MHRISAYKLACILCALLAALGYASHALFTSFAITDDEGYLLYSIQSVLGGKTIYGETLTQYGPGFYLYQWIYYTIFGLEPGHDVGRLLTLFHWLVTAGLLAWLAQRNDSRMAVSMVIGLGAIAFLHSNSFEPSHPGSLLALITALSLVLLTQGKNSPPSLLALAALAGFATLVKVNCGALLVLMWLGAELLECGRLASLIRYGLLFALQSGVLLILTRERVHDAGVQIFIAANVFFQASLWLSFAGQAPATEQGMRWRPHLQRCLVYAGGFGLTVAGLLTLACTLGILDPRTLIEGMIQRPLDMAKAYPAPFTWNPKLIEASATAILLYIISVSVRNPPWVRRAAQVTAIGTAIILAIYDQASRTHSGILDVGIASYLSVLLFSWAPLQLLLDLATNLRARRVLECACLAATWGILQAYPVPGSQIAWGLFPIVLVWGWAAVTLLAQLGSHPWLRARVSAWGSARYRWAWAIAWLSLTTAWLGLLGTHYLKLVPFDLPGAHWVRYHRHVVGMIRSIAHTTCSSNSTLISYPGMLSFNLLSRTEPPHGLGLTHWYSLVDQGTLDQTMQQLVERQDLLLLRCNDHLDFLRSSGLLPHTTLQEWVESKFVFAFGFKELGLYTPVDHPPPVPLQAFNLTIDQGGRTYLSCRMAATSSALKADTAWVHYTYKADNYRVRLPLSRWQESHIPQRYAEAALPLPQTLVVELQQATDLYLIFESEAGRELDFAICPPTSIEALQPRDPQPPATP